MLARVAEWAALVLFLALAPFVALASRFASRPIDVGLGPEPMINNIYHKKALERFGYSAETFVNSVYFITADFDFRGDLKIRWPFHFLLDYYLFIRALFRYRSLYIYFNGGPLMGRPVAWRYEPRLYRLAGIKTVVMPYGGDVQDMSRSPNMRFKHGMTVDYPMHHRQRQRVVAQVDMWTRWADHVISGVEWVDYMYHWDTLMLGHFSIDTGQWQLSEVEPGAQGALRILHAPNHKAIKGTEHFVRAVAELRREGVDVELVMLQGVPNDQIRHVMSEVDVVADQLVVGWYAMFALEAMAMGKPVLCYLRQDLLDLYEFAGLVRPGEIPIVNCDWRTVKERIRHLAENREEIAELAVLGREFVEAHHSLESVGAVFARINASLGLGPAAHPDSVNS